MNFLLQVDRDELQLPLLPVQTTTADDSNNRNSDDNKERLAVVAYDQLMEKLLPAACQSTIRK